MITLVEINNEIKYYTLVLIDLATNISTLNKKQKNKKQLESLFFFAAYDANHYGHN